MMAEHFPKPAVPPGALLADVAIVLGRLGPCRREGQNAYFAGQFLVEQIPVQPDHDLHVFADRVDLRTAILDSYARSHSFGEKPPDGEDQIAANERKHAREHQKGSEGCESDTALRKRAHVLDNLKAPNPGLRQAHVHDASVLYDRPVRNAYLDPDGHDSFAVFDDASRGEKERLGREQAVC